jgi:mannose-6-phosphate isomerase class I
MLPVHLHADDEAAQRLEGEPHGKTEAWHILAAAAGATALVGVREGVDKAALRDALLHQDYDSVMRRLPVRAGQTIHVPGGTLHCFGPDTLLYEIQQTSDVLQNAMPHNMTDGAYLDTDVWHRNLDMLLEEIKLDSRPSFNPGLRVSAGQDVDRVICCASPYYTLERWSVGTVAPMRHTFDTATIVTNVGSAVTVTSGDWKETLGRAETLLVPAALGSVEISGPADLLVGYLPDLEKDIVAPLTAAGYGREVIASLGEVFPS